MHIATPECEADEMSLFSKQYHGIRRRDGLCSFSLPLSIEFERWTSHIP